MVGSGVLSFAKGFDEDMRKAISDSALLAELVADKRADSKADPAGWFKVYAEVLRISAGISKKRTLTFVMCSHIRPKVTAVPIAAHSCASLVKIFQNSSSTFRRASG